MDAGNPWAFGWNQLLTIIGLAVTSLIAIGGFRTFGRWKREKIEERRIDVALEALSIGYESQGVFEAIRNPGSFGYEYEDMPKIEGESDDEWRRCVWQALWQLTVGCEILFQSGFPGCRKTFDHQL